VLADGRFHKQLSRRQITPHPATAVRHGSDVLRQWHRGPP
jgi:hypothetical protein